MLHDIAKVYGYGKIKKYIDVYSEIFEPLKDKQLNILELGVFDGGSLKMWYQYFNFSRIVGLDWNIDKKVNLDGFDDRIEMYHGDQGDVNVLQKIVNDYKFFDIIIDDASHIAEKTKISFDFLFPFLKSNGFYVIEDWGTGYWESWKDGKDFKDHHYQGMVGFIKDLVDESGCDDIKSKNSSSLFQYLRLSHGQAIVKKK
jgi:hypothetical protein